MHLTKSEQQIMEIFWQADHAMAQTEVVSTCVDRKWKERSIFSMLNSLMEKGVPVSYTHLDVYKRQALPCRVCDACGLRLL